MSLTFASSPRSTLGVEWELQLVDADSADLRQCAIPVLAAVEDAHPNNGCVHSEMLLNTVEVTSRPRSTVAECVADIEKAKEWVESASTPLRIELLAAGSHPFADPIYQQVTDNVRYRELVARTQYWGRQMLLYGTHVHVGVEKRDKVIPLVNYVCTKLGHIQALFASSPYWAGTDTGYCDNRAMVFQQLPTAGMPQHMNDWRDLEDFAAGMLKTGVIDSFDEVRWDIRPSLKFGTIEVRVGDAVSNTKELKAYAALVHALIETGSRRLDAGEDLDVLPPWFVGENRWRAARYGMDAILIDDARGEESPLTESLPGWLEELTPAAHDLQCAEELWSIESIVAAGVGYQRQRAVYEHTGSLVAVVEFLKAEMRAGCPLDPEVVADYAVGETWARSTGKDVRL